MTDQLKEFLNGKTEYTLSLFRFFIDELNTLGVFEVKATKTMIALQSTVQFAYVTQLGKNFIHIVLPFNQPFDNQLCFSKIANVPGTNQFNHHLRIYNAEDFNDEVMYFLKLAYEGNYHA
ncbi:MAG: DUF5655 domain-containing protein [Pedobacter agri]